MGDRRNAGRATVAIVAMATALAWLPVSPAAAQNRRAAPAEHWVATWGTAQQLTTPTFGGRGGRGGRAGDGEGRGTPAPVPASGSAESAARGAGASNAPAAGVATSQGTGRGEAGSQQAPFRRVAPQPANVPPTLSDQTVRMIVRTSIGGESVRVSLSNRMGAEPLEIGAARIAVHRGGGSIDPATDRPLQFGGRATIVVPPGALVVSDPVRLDVAPLSDLAVSLYLPHETGPPTTHSVALRTGYIVSGDATARPTIAPDTTIAAYLWLTSVDVQARNDAFAIVALGDSITDGFGTSHDANRAWPTLLAARLARERGMPPVAVINQGISGNQVLRDGAGSSMLARFDRDVLGRPGVRWLILLGGINDINIRGRADGPAALSSEDVIAAYRQIVARSHAHGIKVVGATLTPEEGVPTASARGEAIRQEVNRWIRTPGTFDAVVDFDAALRDPEYPARLKAEFDPGDHIHPNDEGNRVMAEAFDLKVFR
jgi:lysophospholipase L1-like esterase